MAFLVRHLELLVYFEVELDNPRSPDRIASGIAELSGRSLDKGIQTEISGRGRIVEIRADTRRIGAIVSARTGAGIVHSTNSQIPGLAGLQSQDAADLPTADD